ncbi:MAG: ribonuclease T2 [Pseudaminobacter sp.]|nr:ribonuclease T2 [Pseudaminobacter sp.]
MLAGCEPARQPAAEADTPEAAAAPANLPEGKGFDFYVLALSWSPSYCEVEGEDANRQQCSSGRPYGFVVHGLWPQFERGYPESCPTGEESVGNSALRTLYDIMPSAGLIRHQWRKHGSCSGLSQSDYFAVLRRARETVAIPPEFHEMNSKRTLDPDDAERAFVQSNQGLGEDGIAVTCDNGYLRDVRICLTRNLSFRACEEVDRRSCRTPKVKMPSPGG